MTDAYHAGAFQNIKLRADGERVKGNIRLPKKPDGSVCDCPPAGLDGRARQRTRSPNTRRHRLERESVVDNVRDSPRLDRIGVRRPPCSVGRKLAQNSAYPVMILIPA